MSERMLPPLTAVRCFEAAARHGNFTRAAGELGMSQAAVSYQIRLLEERLGMPLFLRHPRGVALSEAGQRLAPGVRDAFAALRASFEALETATSEVLSVNSLPTFASNWLVARLGSFQVAHPDIAVRLSVADEVLDFDREEMDVAIRSGDGHWPGTVAHELMPIAFTPMASPQFIATHGPIDAPRDLLDLPLIDPHDPWWAAWFAEAGVAVPDFSARKGIDVNSQHLAGNAALAGAGAAVLSPDLFGAELASGRLVALFDLVHRSARSYWLVYAEARRRSRKIRHFREWLLGELSGGKRAAIRITAMAVPGESRENGPADP